MASASCRHDFKKNQRNSWGHWAALISFWNATKQTFMTKTRKHDVGIGLVLFYTAAKCWNLQFSRGIISVASARSLSFWMRDSTAKTSRTVKGPRVGDGARVGRAPFRGWGLYLPCFTVFSSFSVTHLQRLVRLSKQCNRCGGDFLNTRYWLIDWIYCLHQTAW